MVYAGGLTFVPVAGITLDAAKIDYAVHETLSLEAILPHLRPGVMSIRRVETGIIAESHRSLPFTGSLLWAQLAAGLLSGMDISF